MQTADSVGLWKCSAQLQLLSTTGLTSAVWASTMWVGLLVRLVRVSQLHRREREEEGEGGRRKGREGRRKGREGRRKGREEWRGR